MIFLIFLKNQFLKNVTLKDFIILFIFQLKILQVKLISTNKQDLNINGSYTQFLDNKLFLHVGLHILDCNILVLDFSCIYKKVIDRNIHCSTFYCWYHMLNQEIDIENQCRHIWNFGFFCPNPFQCIRDHRNIYNQHNSLNFSLSR